MERFLLPFLLTTLLFGCVSGQKSGRQLFNHYLEYKEPSVINRRFKHSDLVAFLQKKEGTLDIQKAGQSVEGRDIYKVTIGNGPVKVLLWSQMHGDEPTATMAIMDILNFFSTSDKFDAFRKRIKKRLTLVFIPMLNPDGAEKFQRRNAMDFDLNRDAARVQMPEAYLLKSTQHELSPEWGFNLHDQSRYYSAGHTGKLATISFLAPAFNYEKDINEGRANAMKLIGILSNALEQFIPGQIAKYNDDFEPRAFGDNIQKWGTNTILIESGGEKGDREKQRIRQLNFVTLLTAFEAIANRVYENTTVTKYESLPFNRGNAFHDLLIRQVFIPKGKDWVISDIAFRLKEKHLSSACKNFYLEGSIADIGDLSTYYGYEELDARGLYCFKGKPAPKSIKTEEQFLNLNVTNLWKEGITDLMVSDKVYKKYIHQKLPFALMRGDKPGDYQLLIGKNPGLYLKNKERIAYVVINGHLYEVPKSKITVRNWLQNNN